MGIFDALEDVGDLFAGMGPLGMAVAGGTDILDSLFGTNNQALAGQDQRVIRATPVGGVLRQWGNGRGGSGPVTGGQMADGRYFAIKKTGAVKYYRLPKNTDRARMMRVVRGHERDDRLLRSIANSPALRRYKAPGKAAVKRKR